MQACGSSQQEGQHQWDVAAAAALVCQLVTRVVMALMFCWVLLHLGGVAGGDPSRGFCK